MYIHYIVERLDLAMSNIVSLYKKISMKRDFAAGVLSVRVTLPSSDPTLHTVYVYSIFKHLGFGVFIVN
jgi:hypothetical protein